MELHTSNNFLPLNILKNQRNLWEAETSTNLRCFKLTVGLKCNKDQLNNNYDERNIN